MSQISNETGKTTTRSLAISVVIAVAVYVLTGQVLALVLYPFYDTIVRNDRGLPILFGALWGIALLGSVEPMPGSIEGVIYTEIPLLGHLVVLVAGAVEVFVFSWTCLTSSSASTTRRGRSSLWPVRRTAMETATPPVGWRSSRCAVSPN